MLNSSGTDCGMGEINQRKKTNATSNAPTNNRVELSMLGGVRLKRYTPSAGVGKPHVTTRDRARVGRLVHGCYFWRIGGSRHEGI